MEKVLYLLGAGFSAPLGLPVMSNFLTKSKDMFANEPAKYAHFEKIFKTIGEMHVCKTYFESDLLNIEEILSILEMRKGLNSPEETQPFVDYICDVINEYTPQLEPPPRSAHASQGLSALLFGGSNWNTSIYGTFVASLFNLQFSEYYPNPSEPPRIRFTAAKHPDVEYSVLSLNYDLVLENACLFFNQHHTSQDDISFKVDFETANADSSKHVPLVKLHGSVDSQKIIAPTWNKNLHPDLVPKWRKAHELIAEANHIRILGYSLPTTDAYIKYLLKSAIVNSKNLKTFDVLCMGSGVRSRYDDFVRFNFYRFRELDLRDYLQENLRLSMSSDSRGKCDKLELAHEYSMNKRPQA